MARGERVSESARVRERKRERERGRERGGEREIKNECLRESLLLNDRRYNYSINNGSSNPRDGVSITETQVKFHLQKNRDFRINSWNRKIRVK